MRISDVDTIMNDDDIVKTGGVLAQRVEYSGGFYVDMYAIVIVTSVNLTDQPLHLCRIFMNDY